MKILLPKKFVVGALLFMACALNLSAQNGNMRYLIMTSPGTISNFMQSHGLDTVEVLAVSGPVDARDFKVMRDEMHKLRVLDLSKASIVRYCGKNGTRSAAGSELDSSVYEANTLPACAFRNELSISDHAIRKVILPNTITAIGREAFKGCYALTEMSVPPLVKVIGVEAFKLCNALTRVALPNTLSVIDTAAFFYCQALETINIPEYVHKINNETFAGCIKLKTVYMHEWVSFIAPDAFIGSSKNIEVSRNNKLYYSDYGVTIDVANKKLMYCPIAKQGTYAIPASIYYIGNNAFEDCTKLTAIIVPKTILSILPNAFRNCTGITDINLTAMYLKKISNNCFAGCSNLTSVTLPASLNIVDYNAFKACNNIKTINNYRSVPIRIGLNSHIFDELDLNACVLHVPQGSKAMYQKAEEWKDFVNIVDDLKLMQ